MNFFKKCLENHNNLLYKAALYKTCVHGEQILFRHVNTEKSGGEIWLCLPGRMH